MLAYVHHVVLFAVYPFLLARLRRRPLHPSPALPNALLRRGAILQLWGHSQFVGLTDERVPSGLKKRFGFDLVIHVRVSGTDGRLRFHLGRRHPLSSMSATTTMTTPTETHATTDHDDGAREPHALTRSLTARRRLSGVFASRRSLALFPDTGAKKKKGVEMGRVRVGEKV